MFFLDLPTAEQRKTIWKNYVPMFGWERDRTLPQDDNWTGAEIRADCRLAALLDVPLKAVAQYAVPVAATATESVETFREWASGRCLSADKPGIYARPKAVRRTRRRKISTDLSVN